MARKAKKDVVVATHNPDFAAEIKRITFDKEEAVAKLADDIDQDERDNDIAGMCTACEKKAVEFCGKCHCAGYCSRQCQVADWPLHKKVCPDFAGTAALDKRPSPEHRRIIFFPTHSTKPELHWAIHHETPNQSLQFGHPEFGKFSTMSYPEGSAKYEGHMVLNLTHSLGNRRVGHMLTAIAYTLHGCVPAPHSPRLVNQSINALTKPGYIRPYFGSMAVFADARRPNETVPPKIRDISARDVHSIMRLIEGRDCTSIANPTGYHGETIAGLRINDPANEFNVAMGLTTVYDAATVPLSPVWNSDFVIALAFHLGLRWYIRPAHFIGLKSGTTTWRDGNLRYLAHVCTLHVAATTTPTTTPTQGESQGAGAPAYDVVFNYGPFSGSVVILHGSGHRVNVHHVLAFNAYLDEVYVTKTTASKAGFQQFWARYQQTAGGGGGRGLSSCVPSPYRWEKPEVKDRLGVFHPDFVMQKVTGEIRGVWMATIEMMNNRK
ncbi:hypothetical protein C8A00DRAFT_15351 [Chaetomidium leptoderma]|uniref:MYND-type domain-containing protein n=1 Tax=Chaetomidium leptoderma TaxID=669021 RepID=A0AAN6VMB9_9PEZI|nr:hypothetical protein C8A00DRAFT_15351 [Chaetomidium leptoderma]